MHAGCAVGCCLTSCSLSLEQTTAATSAWLMMYCTASGPEGRRRGRGVEGKGNQEKQDETKENKEGRR